MGSIYFPDMESPGKDRNMYVDIQLVTISRSPIKETEKYISRNFFRPHYNDSKN